MYGGGERDSTNVPNVNKRTGLVIYGWTYICCLCDTFKTTLSFSTGEIAYDKTLTGTTETCIKAMEREFIL